MNQSHHHYPSENDSLISHPNDDESITKDQRCHPSDGTIFNFQIAQCHDSNNNLSLSSQNKLYYNVITKMTRMILLCLFALCAVAFIVLVPSPFNWNAERSNMIMPSVLQIPLNDNEASIESPLYHRNFMIRNSKRRFQRDSQALRQYASSFQTTTQLYQEGATHPKQQKSKVKIAFLGNSILYYNDCPRIVQQMIMSVGYDVEQDSCLRGGATLTSLWSHGNGVIHKFATNAALLRLESPSDASSSASNNDDIGTKSSSSSHYVRENGVVSSPRLVHPPNNHDYDTGARNPQQLLSYDHRRRSRWYNRNTNPQNNVGWDFLILNDYTQGPARTRTRRQSIRTIRNKIAPLLKSSSDIDPQQTKVTIPIIVQTQAYRVPGVKGSQDLGNFHSFSNRLAAGVREYASAFDEALLGGSATTGTETTSSQQSSSSIARIAPVGEAYRYLYMHNRSLFNKLYSWDNKHPSPYGTYLQACVIFITCFQSQGSDATITPPKYNPNWWKASRYLMPPVPLDYYYADNDNYMQGTKPISRTTNNNRNTKNDDHGLFHAQFPSEAEATTLRRVACHICGIVC